MRLNVKSHVFLVANAIIPEGYLLSETEYIF